MVSVRVPGKHTDEWYNRYVDTSIIDGKSILEIQLPENVFEVEHLSLTEEDDERGILMEQGKLIVASSVLDSEMRLAKFDTVPEYDDYNITV